MAENKASVRIPNGKNYYVLSYRHPVVKDDKGNGKKIQRGTGTSDIQRAEELKYQLDELIVNEKWHSVAKRRDAESIFDRIVVEAFFDCMPQKVEDNHALDIIPLRTKVEGFPHYALVGMSGGGKTSLLRKMLGTTKDSFPTTSTNRTTTCEMEIIKAKEKEYKIAVQFMSRTELEADLLDNISDAIQRVVETEKEEDIDDVELLITLMNHHEMSTRLSYLFGMPEIKTDEDEDEYEEKNEEADVEDNIAVSENSIDKAKQEQFLWDLEDKVKKIAQKYAGEQYSFDQIEANISEDDDVLGLIEDIVTAVIAKFDMLKEGKRTNPKDIWPEGWFYSTPDYNKFIKWAKVFVSDNYRAWGSLLTPLVKAIRIQGPFVGDGEEDVEQEVIMDGIGLGHTTNSSSIPSSVLKRCERSDAIIFVDSATNPMMANAKDGLKSLIEYGYADKIIVAFTKMDLVDGNNYRGLSDKKKHVQATLENYLKFLRKSSNTVLSDTEVQGIMGNCLYFSKLDKTEVSNLTSNNLLKLREQANQIVSKHISTNDVKFDYEALKLYYYLKESTIKFRRMWAEKTGYSAITGKTEHWTRIKALARRLGFLGQENYCELQPLADFAAIVQENINVFINQPEAVCPTQTCEEMQDELKRTLKRSIGIGFGQLNRQRMWTEQNQYSSWQKAYNEVGTGARFRRARVIETIFDEAAPYLADIPNLTEEQEEYLHAVIELVNQVLADNHCQLKKFSC